MILNRIQTTMVHNSRQLIIIALLAALQFAPGRSAVADIYQYTDEHGVIHFSNVGVTGAHKPGRIKVKPESNHHPKGQANGSVLSSNNSDAPGRAGLTAPDAYADIISRVCSRHGVDPALVQAIVKVESDFNPLALSSKGAMGLMQLMPQTAVDLNVRNTFNPHENIDGGVKYLRYLIDRYAGNLSLALAAYNSGETAVRKWGTVPPFPETQNYVKKILALYNGGGIASTPAGYTIYMSYGQDGVLLFTDNPGKRRTAKRKRNDL